MKQNQKTIHKFARYQRGMSLPGTMLAFLIAGLSLVTLLGMYNDTKRSQRLEGVTQDLMRIATVAQATYGATNQYNQVTTAIAVSGGVIPENRRVAGTQTARNIYNGSIDIAPATIATANDSLKITFQEVLRSDCQQLVQMTQGIARIIEVGSSEVKPLDSGVSLASLSSACEGAEKVSVHWTIGRS